jgi:hypothetical protein
MVVGGGDQHFVVNLWFFVGGLSGERVFGRFDVVEIAILFLLLGTHFFVVLFELLGGGESWQQGEVRRHYFIFITYFNIIFNIYFD